MKKHRILSLLLTGMALCASFSGCGNPRSPVVLPSATVAGTDDTVLTDSTETETGKAGETDIDIGVENTDKTDTAEAIQDGPYGQIRISLPDGWSHRLCPVDSGQLITGLYGIQFYPSDMSEGYIEVNYSDRFGVCGTGLCSESTTLAGKTVSVGTYDNNPYWNFITFDGDYEGIVALTNCVDDWPDDCRRQVMDILDTISFDTTLREGGAYIYNDASEINQIGLSLSLKNISATGATLVFSQYDADAPTGELNYGSAFVLEAERNGTWEEAPIVVEGNYAFNAAACIIKNGTTSETQLDWEWLYGTLAPGNYRLKKEIMDFRAAGDFDKYTVTAYFLLN